MFLCTASINGTGAFIRSLVEGKHHGDTIVDIIGTKLDALTIAILSGTKMSREAMTDLLKVTFNLLLHYPKVNSRASSTDASNSSQMVECEPQALGGKGKAKDPPDDKKVMGDFWSSKLDGFALIYLLYVTPLIRNLDSILPPLLRVFNTLPPTFPNPLAAPLTHVIHALITIPIQPSSRSVWIGPAVSSRSSSSGSSPPTTVKHTISGSTSRSHSPPTSYSKDPKPGAIDRALSVLSAGRRSLSRSPSPLPSHAHTDVVLRAYDLLDVSLSHYIPGTIDPDDPSVIERCKEESDGTLDDLLSPLVVLMTRLCAADEPSRIRVREWLIPADIDRTQLLETRSDLLGRCLRILPSVHHTRLKDAVGEMLFAMCDSDGQSFFNSKVTRNHR